MQTRDIVFIHGMYMTPLCWEKWIDYYQSKGRRCMAPAWPGREEPIEAQRKKHPDPALGRLKLRDVVDRMETFIKSLAGKPVVIGHSMGGLVAQLLLQKDLAAAAVAIDPAPPQGVITLAWPDSSIASSIRCRRTSSVQPMIATRSPSRAACRYRV